MSCASSYFVASTSSSSSQLSRTDETPVDRTFCGQYRTHRRYLVPRQAHPHCDHRTCQHREVPSRFAGSLSRQWQCNRPLTTASHRDFAVPLTARDWVGLRPSRTRWWTCWVPGRFQLEGLLVRCQWRSCCWRQQDLSHTFWHAASDDTTASRTHPTGQYTRESLWSAASAVKAVYIAA